MSLKEIDLKVMSELLRNSYRSDREISRTLGVSQPRVAKTRAKLETEGYISEYTVIPDFQKLGYHLFALTFFTSKKELGRNDWEAARKFGMDRAPSAASNIVLIERGIGLGYDSFMASFHKDYAAYTNMIGEIKKAPYLDSGRVDSFVVDLDDEVHYRYLTFSTLANHLLKMHEKKETT